MRLYSHTHPDGTLVGYAVCVQAAGRHRLGKIGMSMPAPTLCLSSVNSSCCLRSIKSSHKAESPGHSQLPKAHTVAYAIAVLHREKDLPLSVVRPCSLWRRKFSSGHCKVASSLFSTLLLSSLLDTGAEEGGQPSV